MSYTIRKMAASDWGAVERIFTQGIATNMASFRTVCPTWAQFDGMYHDDQRYVMTDGRRVLGWVSGFPVSSIPAYDGVLEISLYIDPAHNGKGLGKLLLQHFIKVTEESGFWTLHSSIIDGNLPSIALHEKCGFRLIGKRERICRDHLGVFKDAILMERRSLLEVFE